ncbi:MAG: hypothetical protein M3Q44_05330 [bacterium]|nr:hypothetical protein [bacterium]
MNIRISNTGLVLAEITLVVSLLLLLSEYLLQSNILFATYTTAMALVAIDQIQLMFSSKSFIPGADRNIVIVYSILLNLMLAYSLGTLTDYLTAREKRLGKNRT